MDIELTEILDDKSCSKTKFCFTFNETDPKPSKDFH
jgi:hypothetical protein